MQEAVLRMLDRYSVKSPNEAIRALREIIQECALLGLWRGKFFEHAAFYGGTALRILHRLDRFSEDLDFTLLKPEPEFRLASYAASLQRELLALGFDVHMDLHQKVVPSHVHSVFLKTNTRACLLQIGIPETMVQVPANQTIRIKIEIDRDPPPGFETESRYVLLPLPFSVRVCTLPDLFAGKMHALLYRRWKNRVKGRDWYDFVWFVSHHPVLHLAHLEQRMRQTEHWSKEQELTEGEFQALLRDAIKQLNINQAREEVRPFLKDPRSVDVWSEDFFVALAARIEYTRDQTRST
jgi:predicted nucleotidyltransferase component of viral defense system